MTIQTIINPVADVDYIFNIVAQNCEFYKDQNGEQFMVSYTTTGYTLVYLSNFDESNIFIRGIYHGACSKIAKKSDILNVYDTIRSLTATADMKPVFTRIGHHDDCIYYDLVNNDEVIKLDGCSTQVVSLKAIPDIFFVRNTHQKAQAYPKANRTALFDFLEKFFNIAKDQIILLAVYICVAFIPHISHPILLLEGDHGAGKSSFFRMLLTLINPCSRDVLQLPSKNDDLVTSLSNNYFAIYDNIGKLSNELSNTLCQAATGGTLTKRKLYTDNTEICINIKRLVALNGLDLDIKQKDLLDRVITLKLKRIDDNKRLPETIIFNQFNAMLPNILGNIFEIVQKAISLYPTLTPSKYTRMADFCGYGYAIGEAMGDGYGEKFLEEYTKNITLSALAGFDDSPLFYCVRTLLDTEDGYFKGEPKVILERFQNIISFSHKHSQADLSFLSSASMLSKVLKNHQSELKLLGVQFNRGRNSDRFIEFRYAEESDNSDNE